MVDVNSKAFDLMTTAADATNVFEDESDIAFDPEGSDYDYKTALELMELYPLTMAKPERLGGYEGETLSDEDSFQAWVWHDDEKDWVKHGGTLDPRTGMLLKGMARDSKPGSEAFESIRKGIEEEERLGNKFITKNGRYYSVPKQ